MIPDFRESQMILRTLASGALVMLLTATAASALDVSDVGPDGRGAPGVPLPTIGLPGVFGSGTEQQIQLAQAATDPRVVALEEQVRRLSGTIEELNFQILQLQEQLRKLQEDNEFRFQELEKKSQAAGDGVKAADAGKSDRAAPADVATTGTADGTAQANGSSIEQIITEDQGVPAAGDATAQGAGEPPKNFGTLTVDADGNVVDSNAQADAAQHGADDTVVAALPQTNDPEELYRNAYQFILSGEYSTAETGFRDHIARFPQDARAPDAHFWLGEALLGQKKYRDAAEVFLGASKDYPNAKKGPDMLLKLGIALVGLNQRDVACATFGEVGKRYPDASGALKARVKQEATLAAC